MSRVDRKNQARPTPAGAWLGVQEVAREFDLPVNWVYRAASSDPPLLPCYKFGKYLKFRRDELLDWAESKRRRPAGSEAR